MIMGLPITWFALMMTAVIGSLLFIIFSFSFLAIIGVFIFNAILYIALTHFAKHPFLLNYSKVFPHAISNKKQSYLHYENY